MSFARRILLPLCLCAAFLVGEPVATCAAPASTSQRDKAARKKAAKKRKAEKKRAAKKAALAKAAEKKRQAAKKKRLKEGKPMLYVYSFDAKTNTPLPATHIVLQDVNAKPTKKPKINKPTDNKRARVTKTLPAGRYWVVAAKTGYFTSDTLFFSHTEDEDSVPMALYPETRLVLTVIDSLTSRPVTANVIVRDNNRRKVMQTTSDSLHTHLAVLLDDRVPFYTIDATAVNYFPFHDTIADPHNYVGFLMSPKEIKSFVLREMYFATGKTTILPSSAEALNELYALLATRPELRIRIVGHTDNIGSDRSNQALSEGRSASVRQAMVDRGIQSSRIEIEGRGEKDPIVPNDSEEHRQMNRRVEIELL